MGPNKNSIKRKSGKAESSVETSPAWNSRGSGEATIPPDLEILEFIGHTTKVKLAYSTEDEGKRKGWGKDEYGQTVFYDNIGQRDIEKIKKLREDYQKLFESDNSSEDGSDTSEDSDDDGSSSEATSIFVTLRKGKVSTLKSESEDKGEMITKKVKKPGHYKNDPDVAFASPTIKSQEIWETEQIAKHNIRKLCKIRLRRCDAISKLLPSPQTIPKSNESESQKGTETKNSAYQCTQCGKGFKQKASLKYHSYSHTGEMPFKCDLCPKKYGHYASIYNHMKKEHNVRYKSKQFQNQKMVDMKEIKQHDPDKSNGLLESGCNAEHILLDTEDKIKLTAKTKLPFAKPRHFPCLKRRKHHQRDNKQRKHPNVSSDDGKSNAITTNFESDDDLFEPIVSKVTSKKDRDNSKSTTMTTKDYDKSKPYPCLECGKRFGRNGALKRHNYIHTGERPFKCKTCPASFRRKAHLADHTSVHTNGRPFKCKTCPASFKQKGHLAKHTSVHTNGRPFKCKTCPASFYRKNNLTQHMSIHAYEKPFKCSTCSASFNLKHVLANHIKRWHLRKPVLQKPKTSMATQGENGKRKRPWKKSGASNNHHFSKHLVQEIRQTPSPELFQIVEFPECKIILTRCDDIIHLPQIDSSNAAVNNQKSQPDSNRESGGSTYVEFEGVNLPGEEVSDFDLLTDKAIQEDESRTEGCLPDQPNTDSNASVVEDVLNELTDFFDKKMNGEFPMDSDSETLVAQPNILFEGSDVTEAFKDLQNNVDQISTQDDTDNLLEKNSEQNLIPTLENDCARDDVSSFVNDGHNASNPEMSDSISSNKVSETEIEENCKAENKCVQVASKDLALHLNHSDFPVSTTGIKEVVDSLLKSACEIDEARNETEKESLKNSNLSSKVPANMAAMESVFEAVIRNAAQRQNESVTMESNKKIEGSSPSHSSSESMTPTEVCYPEVNKESNLPNTQLSVKSCGTDLNEGKLPSPTPTESTIVSDELDSNDINLDLDLKDLLRKEAVPEHDGQCDKANEETASGNVTVTDDTSNCVSQKDAENKTLEKSDSVDVNRSRKTKKVTKRKRKHEALKVVPVGHQCLYCSRQFRERYRLVIHMVTFHKAEKLVSCTLCEKLFSKNYLEKHLNTVHNWTMPTQEEVK